MRVVQPHHLVIFLCRLLLLLALIAARPTFAAGDKPDLAPLKRWLARQEEVRTVQADFVQTRTFHALRDPLASPGHLWFSAPNRFRWELGDPPKTVVLRKGEGGFLIQPNKRRAERLDSATSGQPGGSNAMPMLNFPLAKDYEDFNRQFEVLALAATGTRCRAELLPRDPQARKFLETLRLDFDTDTGNLLSFEAVTKDGSSLRNEFSNVRLNQKIDPRVFDFDLTGYEVADAKR